MMNDGKADIILRALEPEDLDFLYSIENDPDLWDVGCTNVPYSRHILSEYILANKSDLYADKQLRLIVTDGRGKQIGVIDLFNFEPKHLRAELGIAILREYRNRGYGQMAIDRLMRYCKRHLHLHQIYAVVGENNQQSLKMFRNADFQEGARMKDWIYDGNRFQDAIVMRIFL